MEKNKKQLNQLNIEIPAFVKSIKPGNNFYKHVNGHWLQKTSIPPFRSSFGVSEEVEMLIENQLRSILSKCYTFSEKGVKASTKREKMMDVIGRFMLSSLRKGKQQNSIDFLRKRLRTLYCIRNQDDVAGLIGNFNKCGVPTFLSISVFKKREAANEYTFLIDKGTLGLPDITYYNATAPGKSHTLMAYVNLCNEVTKYLVTDDIRSAVQIEAGLAAAMDQYKDTDFQDIEGNVLHRTFPGIPWNTLFKEYGVEEKVWKSKTIRIYSKKFIEYLEKLFKIWSFDTWTKLLSLHMILYALPILPQPFDTLHFNFFGKRLRGQVEKLPQDQLTLNLCRTLLRTPLSYLYIEDYIRSDLKKEGTAFINTIQNHTVKKLENVEWLEPATRKIAIDKVKKMNLGVSHPDILPNIEIPNLITDTFLENMLLLGEMNTKSYIDRLHTKNTDIWDEAPYVVNAYYFNERNQFILPAGSIQWPFYKYSKTIGWNYGGLGAVIGHEITHAFDIDGKEFTATGEKKNWWTKKDNYQYKKRTDELITLFDKGKILGHSVDGYLTLSENLADLGGLAIALDALKYELKNASEDEKKKQIKDFFISYAVSWRVKEREKKIIQSLFLDVHSPAELRVNYIVSQFDEWYELFGVVTGNSLYIPSEERIRIF
jgi:putative endopeptidase